MKTQERQDKRFRITYYDINHVKLYHVFIWCKSLRDAKTLLYYSMLYRKSKNDSIVSYGKVRYDRLKNEN